MALNPTVMDIRWQPEEDMKLLKQRLSESFEYSDEVSDKYICKLAGNIVTQRRSKLWHIQRQGG
jgi:DNA/RNA endonuclease YhcR with UshA esterase domain